MTAQHQEQVAVAAARLALPPGVTIRPWTDADFAAIQRLSDAESWPTPRERPAAALLAWQHSWPALVATAGTAAGTVVVGFLRALSDGAVTTYVAEILVAPAWRAHGVGAALLAMCHALAPDTRLDLLSTTGTAQFYVAHGFRRFPGFRKSAADAD